MAGVLHEVLEEGDKMNLTKKGFKGIKETWKPFLTILAFIAVFGLSLWIGIEAANTPQDQMDKYMSSPAAPISRWEFILLPLFVVIVSFVVAWRY